MIAALLLFLSPVLFAQATGPDISGGAKVFAASCAVGYCHGNDGAANRGPRLRGRTFEAGYVDRVVRQGIPNTAMPAFETRLKADDLALVVAWVGSISPTTAEAASSGTPAAGKPVVVPVPADAARGRDVFFDALRGTRCGTCHQVDGRGINAGPDITGLKAIRDPAVKRVNQVALPDGETFPALTVAEDKTMIQLFDLTTTPPSLRTFPRDRVGSMDTVPNWSHAEAVQSYTDAELDSVSAYLAWLARPR